jgi:hypothetical protein
VNVYYLCDATGVYGLLYDPPQTMPARPARLRAYWAFGELNYQRLRANALTTERFAPCPLISGPGLFRHRFSAGEQ